MLRTVGVRPANVHPVDASNKVSGLGTSPNVTLGGKYVPKRPYTEQDAGRDDGCEPDSDPDHDPAHQPVQGTRGDRDRDPAHDAERDADADPGGREQEAIGGHEVELLAQFSAGDPSSDE